MRRNNKLVTVTRRATLRAAGLKEFEISQSSSSVKTAERAIVVEKVTAAARFTVVRRFVEDGLISLV